VDEWPLDVEEALKSGLFISGTSGSGKTNLAFLIAERLMNEGVVVYVFDPSQAWHDSPVPQILRVGTYDPIRIFEGSTIYDVSLLYVQQQREYVERFCRELFQQRVSNSQSRNPIFLVFEEAQLYISEGGSRSKAFQELYRIITVGRNYGIRYALITQFAALVDKTAVKMTKQRYFGYTDELNDVHYIVNFIGKNHASELADLKIGEFIYDYGTRTEKVQTPIFKAERRPREIKSEQPLKPLKPEPKAVGWGTDQALALFVWLLLFAVLFCLFNR